MEPVVTYVHSECASPNCPKTGRYWVRCSSCLANFHAVCVNLPDKRYPRYFTCEECLPQEDEDPGSGGILLATCRACQKIESTSAVDVDPDRFLCKFCRFYRLFECNPRNVFDMRAAINNGMCSLESCTKYTGRHCTCYMCFRTYHNGCVGLPEIAIQTFRCEECTGDGQIARRRRQLYPSVLTMTLSTIRHSRRRNGNGSIRRGPCRLCKSVFSS